MIIVMLLVNCIIKLGFIAAGVYTLMNGHPVYAAWCLFGAIAVGYSSDSNNDKTKVEKE